MTFYQKYNSFLTKNSLKITLLLVFFFLAYFYSPILFHPSSYIFNDKGDAVKNYYCYAWHVQNDSSFINYNGTNYPYGELFAYTDGTPLLSNFIKAFSFLKPYSIATFNVSLLLSFFLCALFIHKILTEFKVSPWYLILASFGISVLCPQVIRLSGHLALSYSFIIPLIIYLLIRFEKSQRKTRASVLFSLISLAVFLIHPYLGMICSMFIFFYWLLQIFQFNDVRQKIIALIFQSIIPAIIYFLFVRLSDTHHDRPESPYGFLYFTANIESVFISSQPPFRHFLSLLYKITIQNWEGLAYIGITSLIAIIGFPFILRKYKKSFPDSFHPFLAKPFLFMLISSVLLLLFSMAYPFKWNMEWLLDYMPAIKQFRAPGRFAWVFFFVITIGSTILISNFFFKLLASSLRVILCSVFLLFFLIEGIPLHKINRSLIAPNCFDKHLLDPELSGIISVSAQEKAQAIIPLPFFHIGTDIYDLQGTEKIRRSSLLLSYHSKTPLMANITPRTSLSETREMLQIFSNDLCNKSIKARLDSLRPFFVLYSKEALNESEQNILNKGKLLAENKDYILKEISFQDLFQCQR